MFIGLLVSNYASLVKIVISNISSYELVVSTNQVVRYSPVNQHRPWRFSGWEDKGVH